MEKLEIKELRRMLRCEGNILMNLNKRYLVNILEIISNDYLRYGKQRLSDAEFVDFLKTYSYTPVRQQYTIRNF